MVPLKGLSFFAALDVDVDPLMVAGEVGELVDHVLRDLDLVAPRAERVAYLGAQRVDVVESDILHESSWLERDGVTQAI